PSLSGHPEDLRCLLTAVAPEIGDVVEDRVDLAIVDQTTRIFLDAKKSFFPWPLMPLISLKARIRYSRTWGDQLSVGESAGLMGWPSTSISARVILAHKNLMPRSPPASVAASRSCIVVVCIMEKRDGSLGHCRSFSGISKSKI